MPLLAIVIDDFGGYDQSGVDTMLSIDAPITCAVMPHLENTRKNVEQIISSNKEVIIHMPMEACVNLPQHWYGKEYICNNETKDSTYKKLDNAFQNIPEAKGFNIHIGSGVCQNKNVVNNIYNYSIKNNLFFLDSRTHINTVCDSVARDNNCVYLGRDEFLEPDHNKSYSSVKNHIQIGVNTAKEKGYSIIIGHVGSHGGENTARAIKDSIESIKQQGVKIVSLGELNNELKKRVL